ncbi:hypothetical protein CDAR_420801 [Caerostris darwini]|uniref:Uncharacterized protein n=1 Tax=Caerostris darwini TaxID=1538125 RepID=A0AAV4X4G6_9ARAC|nr:hypothetical protein CDAR_420801 [Caerostris darwini]
MSSVLPNSLFSSYLLFPFDILQQTSGYFLLSLDALSCWFFVCQTNIGAIYALSLPKEKHIRHLRHEAVYIAMEESKTTCEKSYLKDAEDQTKHYRLDRELTMKIESNL